MQLCSFERGAANAEWSPKIKKVAATPQKSEPFAYTLDLSRPSSILPAFPSARRLLASVHRWTATRPSSSNLPRQRRYNGVELDFQAAIDCCNTDGTRRHTRLSSTDCTSRQFPVATEKKLLCLVSGRRKSTCPGHLQLNSIPESATAGPFDGRPADGAQDEQVCCMRQTVVSPLPRQAFCWWFGSCQQQAHLARKAIFCRKSQMCANGGWFAPSTSGVKTPGMYIYFLWSSPCLPLTPFRLVCLVVSSGPREPSNFG